MPNQMCDPKIKYCCLQRIHIYIYIYIERERESKNQYPKQT